MEAARVVWKGTLWAEWSVASMAVRTVVAMVDSMVDL